MFENKVKPLDAIQSQEKIVKSLDKQKANAVDDKISTKNGSKLFKEGKIVYLVLLIVFIIFLIVITTGVALTGISPCTISRCHPNATCINRPFYAECSCKYGFAGDGQHHCDECGKVFYPQNASRIGAVVNPYSWPAFSVIEYDYQTFAEVQREKLFISDSDYCSGTVINRRYILTAARCMRTSFTYFDWYYQTNYTFPIVPNAFYSSIEAMYNIYLGTYYFVYFGVDLPEVYIGYIESVVVHPDFDPNTLQNDLAIIKLRFEINFDKEMQPACLPDKSFTEQLKVNNSAYLVGYGSSNRMMFRRYSLSNSILNILNNSMCDIVDTVRTKDWTKQICAGEFDQFNNQTNYCMGDIGSGLYMPYTVNNQQKFVVAGILSYNEGCRTQHAPGVYTSITNYLDWIRDNSKY